MQHDPQGLHRQALRSLGGRHGAASLYLISDGVDLLGIGIDVVIEADRLGNHPVGVILHLGVRRIWRRPILALHIPGDFLLAL